MSRAQSGRRSENFGVRRWLQLGAASAGMGAAMWGLSLVGPQVGVAAADDGASSSSSSSSGASRGDSGSRNSGPAKRETASRSVERAGNAKGADRSEGVDRAVSKIGAGGRDTEKRESKKPKTVDTPDADVTDGESEVNGGAPDTPSAEPVVHAVSSAELRTDRHVADRTLARLVAVDPVVAESNSAVDEVVAPMALTDPWAMQSSAYAPGWWQQETSARIVAFTHQVQGFVDAMPVDQQIKDVLNGSFWTVRRTFFNLAPTVTQPVEITSGDGGPIVGQVGAVDPEGDRIVYRLTHGPEFGTIQLNSDGSYTYTPGAGFDGVDTFVIAAADTGLHVNLVDWFKAPARVGMLVNQDAIKFDFNVTSGEQHWTPDRLAALREASKHLARYVLVAQPVSLQYNVTGVVLQGGWLAGARSDLISSEAGFWDTVVQHKLQTGIDANGQAADGTIDWNWYYDWALGDTVGATQFDLTSTAMHELMHSFGFLSSLAAPGFNGSRTAWSRYSEFVSTEDGTRPIGSDHKWDSAFDGYLTGAHNGLFFYGTNAMNAYGGNPVPLYTPNNWAQGSSASHLRNSTFSGINKLLMTSSAPPGPAIRVLSAIELGILADLGYTVVPNTVLPSVTSTDPSWLLAA